MADIRVLMVADGNVITFGPRQNPSGGEDDNYFGVSALYTELQNSTTPTFQVDFAHRRGFTFTGRTMAHEDCSAGLTYHGDFVFALATPPAPNTVTADLSQYDVLWLLADEGYNGGVLPPADTEITDPEKIAIANFMAGGGGVFAVGDHDGLGAHMCGKLPRVRVMRRWFEWDHPETDPASGQQFTPNWSVDGLNDPAHPEKTDRNDTLRHDAGNSLFYFFDQSDPTPQPLLDSTGVALPLSNGPIHTILRDANGAIIAQFPDHMHEGEATDLSTAATPPFNPNQSPGVPWKLTYTDAHGNPVSFDEFPIVGGYQPQPEVVAYDSDTGHVTYYDQHAPPPDYPATQAKTRGAVSVYDGHAVGVGRVVTGSTFHHYLDKNLLGDPGTAALTPGGQTEEGLPAAVLSGMQAFYVNVATWLARPNRNFTFLTVKNTFGADEVADAAAHGQIFSDAFYLAIDGYTPNQVGNMPAVALSGPFWNTVTTANFQQGAAIPEDSGSPNTHQRILIPFSVLTIPGGAFPAMGTVVQPLEARLTINGTPLSAEALFELVAGANPYFSNLGSDAADQWYLSQDLRVFQAGPGAPSTPFVAWPASGSGYDYMKSLLLYLNDQSNGYTDGSTDPFAVLSEANDLTEASSVTPNTSNFAVARVRLRGSAGSHTIGGVRVFFRLWEAASNDTDYDAQTSYVSSYDAAHLPDFPLPAPGGLNTPLFASQRSGAGDFDTNVNLRDITVLSGSSERWAYFGCFLDVYNNPAVSLIGTHHCLVAQIAYDAAPITGATGVTLSPENSDKLAQRNIQITPSGHPSPPATHRVPQAFELRPSLRTAHPIGTMPGYPDELMIDWGDVPRGSVAAIYWPQAAAIDVVRLAMLLYGTDLLRVADANTIECRVTSRLTWLPIPFGAGADFAGLFTIDLPQGARRGQEFRIVVRRVRTRRTGRAAITGGQVQFSPALAEPILSTRSRRPARSPADRVVVPVTRDWRYIVGTFQVSIPVESDHHLLRPEEDILAILEWRLQQMPSSDRWYPVLRRWIGYVGGRVDGFGGNSGGILPSPIGVPGGGGPPPHDRDKEELTGKICEVVFDCFGDFTGFILDTCREGRAFASRDRGIGDLVLRACRERLLISVVAERREPKRILKVIIRA